MRKFLAAAGNVIGRFLVVHDNIPEFFYKPVDARRQRTYFITALVVNAYRKITIGHFNNFINHINNMLNDNFFEKEIDDSQHGEEEE